MNEQLEVKLVQEFPVHGAYPTEEYETSANRVITEKFKKQVWAKWAGRIIKVNSRRKPRHWNCNTVYIWQSADEEFNRDCGGAVNLCSHMFEVAKEHFAIRWAKHGDIKQYAQ